MANLSIYSAFERMWQHVTARIDNFITKSDLDNYYTKDEVTDFHSELEAYTDYQVAALVNSAPETLDTIGELAAAFEENKDMVATLNAAVVNKAENSDVQHLSDLVGINATNIESLQSQVLQNTLILADAITGESYSIQIQNGQLVSFKTG